MMCLLLLYAGVAGSDDDVRGISTTNAKTNIQRIDSSTSLPFDEGNIAAAADSATAMSSNLLGELAMNSASSHDDLVNSNEKGMNTGSNSSVNINMDASHYPIIIALIFPGIYIIVLG